MSILAVALSQRAHRQHRNKETIKHILVNYKEPPTLDEVKKDPYFKSYKLDESENLPHINFPCFYLLNILYNNK